MKKRKCYICSKSTFDRVKGKVRDIPGMSILRCKSCGLVFLENFDHIDDKFYENSRMRENQRISAWKAYMLECARDDERRAAWLKSEIRGKAVLDFGCGGGGFLSNIKSTAKKCLGVEKDRNLRRIIKRKLKIATYSDINEVVDKFDFITMFHVLEHFKDPRDILVKLSRLLTKSGRIIIEVPSADDALLSFYESKPFSEFTYWGCHLYLFNASTLKKLIEGAGLSVNYIKQIQRYPLSNHLYWLAKGKPGGHKIWNFIDTKELNKAYEARLADRKACDTLIAMAGRAR